MDKTEEISVSPLRLRIGVVCIVFWWAPIWAAAPAIAKWLGNSDTGQVTFWIMAIQTVIGLLGILIAGKQVLALMKTVPRKKLAKTVWHVLVHGNFEQQG